MRPIIDHLVKYAVRVTAPTSAKERLTHAALDHLLTDGRLDESLRTTATALGVAHSLLLYHFGSHDDLLVAVHRACEQRLRDHLSELRLRTADPVDTMIAMWSHLADPAIWPLYRLGFSLRARGGDPGQATDSDREQWAAVLRPLVIATGVPDDEATAETALWQAVSQGLLWELVTGADPATVDRAARRFIGRCAR